MALRTSAIDSRDSSPGAALPNNPKAKSQALSPLVAGSLPRSIARLVVPVLVEQLLIMLVVQSDALLTGRYLEREHLAAISLMIYLTWALVNLFAVVGIGATAMTARMVGAGQFEDASVVVNQSYLLGAVLALVATIGSWLSAPHVVGLMQLEGRSAALAVEYLNWVVPALPALMLQCVGIACLRGAGDMVTGLVSMSLVNVVNIVLSWGLVLGWGPFPEMGWSGIACGTACGYVVGGIAVTLTLLRGRAGLRLHVRGLRPHWDIMRRLLRIGIPGGTDVMTIVACQLWFLALINQLGDVAAAAHGVAIRIESLGYLPCAAFQLAATTLAGQFLGAGDRRRAARSVWLTMLAAGGVTSAAGLCFLAFSHGLAGFFLSHQSPDVIDLAASLLKIVAIGMPFLAIASTLTGALRGSGDTRIPLVITLTGYLGVRIPLAYLFAHVWHWGVVGAWYAMVTDLTLRSGLALGRFLHGGWQRVEV